MRVLLADDDPDQLSLRCMLLERSGFEAMGAGDYVSAVELAAIQKPECAVVDLRLPTEELGLRLVESAVTRFTRFTHDFGFAGLGTINRIYFHFSLSDIAGLRLQEGAGIAAFAADQALQGLRMVHYDALALWMHHNRGRIGRVGAGEID